MSATFGRPRSTPAAFVGFPAPPPPTSDSRRESRTRVGRAWSVHHHQLIGVVIAEKHRFDRQTSRQVQEGR